MTGSAPSPRAFALALALAAALSAGGTAAGCAPAVTPVGDSDDVRTVPVSAVARANRLDVANAKKVALEYVRALASRDATAAAALMTSYRRAEVRAKSWKREIGGWRTASVTAVLSPGRYINDERAFAQLYAEHFGHPPHQLVVVDVRYVPGPGEPPADTDFVVTRDNAGAPWLVHDFGGALRPSTAPSSSP